MSRRRYLSTKISQDAKINRLAVKHGDFAALLYTWMIPHAEDDGTLSGDPEELLMTVMPGRRDKDVEDITSALSAMEEIGLISWSRNSPHPRVAFPASFYDYQTYITEHRRKPAEASNDAPSATKNSANQRKSAQNASSFKLKLESKLEDISPLSGDNDINAADVAAAPPTTAAISRNHWTKQSAERTAEEVARRTRLRNSDIIPLVSYISACPNLTHEMIIGEAESFVAWLNKSHRAAEARVFYNKWLKPLNQEMQRERGTASAAPLAAEKVLSNGHTTPDAQPPSDPLYEFNVARARAKLVS